MPVTLTDDEGKKLIALFEKMELKPQGETPEELQEWLQDRVFAATTAGAVKSEGEDGEGKSKSAATTGLGSQQFKLSVTFAGDEFIKGTCKYDLWKYEVECIVKEGLCTDEVIKQIIRRSLKGEAAHVLKRLGPDASISKILSKFEGVYGAVEAGEDTLAEFYSAKQKVGEDASAWGCRLEDLLDRASHDEVIGQKDTDQMLRKRFFMGLLPRLKEASRHKYDTIGEFDRLRVVVRSIEHEFKGETLDSEPRRPCLKKAIKSVVAKQVPESSEVKELRGLVHKLTNSVKSMEEQWTKGSGAKATTKYSESRSNFDQVKGATLPRACWNCNDPGHMKHECPELPECYKCHRRGHVQKYCQLNWQ